MEAVMDKIEIERYSAYKDSGVEWLGKIPEHWEALSNKFIFRIKKTQVGKKANKYVLLSLTLNGIIKRDMENPQGKFPAEFDTYQEVKEGDFVFCLFDVEETPRAVGLSHFDGMITGAYTVMEPNEDFDRKFLYYFYLNLDADKRMKPLYKGLRNVIPKEAFFSFKTFVPPVEEQSAIAAFLDRKTAQIDKAIAQKEKLIELLKERRQILIHKAVTRGLDPNIKMKECKAEWYKYVPEHWKVKKLGYLSIVGNGSTPNRGNLAFWEKGSISWLNSSRVNDLIINYPDQFVTSLSVRSCHLPLLKPGTIIIAITGEGKTRGMAALCEIETTINQHLAYIDIHHSELSAFFLLRFLEAMYSNIRADSSGLGSTKGAITCADIRNYRIALPPLEEQRIICEFVVKLSTKTNNAISLKEKEIEKLKEYKATLINAAVTGKIRVA